MKNKLYLVGGIFVVIILIVVLSAVGYYMTSYNSLISLDQDVKQAWSDVEVSYQRRIDLIPNLVATVQGASGFEQETLTQITQLRSEAVSAQQSFSSATTVSEQMDASSQSESVLSRLLVIVENYPQIQSVSAYSDLQIQIEGTENRISVARQRYNEAVNLYNRKVLSFPSNIVAGMHNFAVATSFEASAGANVAPVVVFD
jgi:LemA protein